MAVQLVDVAARSARVEAARDVGCRSEALGRPDLFGSLDELLEGLTVSGRRLGERARVTKLGAAKTVGGVDQAPHAVGGKDRQAIHEPDDGARPSKTGNLGRVARLARADPARYCKVS